MDYSDISLAVALEDARQQLQDELGIAASRVFLTVSPDAFPRSVPSGGEFYTVSPGGGAFDDAMGAPRELCHERSQIAATGFVYRGTDEPGRDGDLLTNATNGILVVKKRILDALQGLTIQNTDDENAGTQHLMAETASPPRVVELVASPGVHWATISVFFAFTHYWDLG